MTRPAKPEVQPVDPIKHAWYRPQALPGHFREKILFLSILLHLLFFVVWENSSRLGLFRVTPPPLPVVEPIVLDLQQPPAAPPKRVIESPPDAEIPEPPEKADFLSDRNARARNETADPSKPMAEDPYNQGDLESHSLPPSPKPAPPVPPVSEPEPKPKPDLLNTDNYVRENFRKQMQEQAQPSERERMGIAHQQLANRVKDMGGLAFNTYNWDFAPYMLRLKAIIEQNIHPPHAFTHLGIISGVTLLRFKIFPDGTLRDLEILDYTGHKTLMETSASAVQISAPFPDLPKNFPEPYLEVTGKFLYLIKDK